MKFCPYCSEKLDESGTQAYCQKCGSNLSKNESVAPSQTQGIAPSPYYPQYYPQYNPPQYYPPQPQVYDKNVVYCPYCNAYVRLTKYFSWLTFCCCLGWWYILYYWLKPLTLCPYCSAKLK